MRRENNRQAEIKELTSKGIIPAEQDIDQHPEKSLQARTWLLGRVAAQIHDVLPAKTIVDNMIKEAVEQIQKGSAHISVKSKL